VASFPAVWQPFFKPTDLVRLIWLPDDFPLDELRSRDSKTVVAMPVDGNI
jgi:hypothetical protein